MTKFAKRAQPGVTVLPSSSLPWPSHRVRPRHPSSTRAIAQPGRRSPPSWAVVAAITLLAAAAFSLASAQPPAKVRIGWLTQAKNAPLEAAFRLGLRELGWVDSENVVIEQRDAEARVERLPDLAADLVRLKVDLIVAVGTTAATAAQKATRTIPVVFIAADPVGAGLIASLARPGANVTGLAPLSLELSAKQLQILREAFPKVASIAVLYRPVAAHRANLKELESAARAMSIRVRPVEARGADDIDRAAVTIASERLEAILPLASPVFNAERHRLVTLAAKARLPAVYEHREYVEAGGLMSYGPDYRQVFRRAAVYVDKILRGARPGDIPVEQPTTFELIINEKTAKALGLTIAPSVLQRADEIIR